MFAKNSAIDVQLGSKYASAGFPPIFIEMGLNMAV